MKLKNLKSVRQLIPLLLLMLTIVSGCAKNNENVQSQQKQVANRENRLNIIKNRGKLICGINDRLPGFSYKEDNGDYSGISVDLCRALAVALFDDPSRIEFRHLDSEERFAAVASGKVDLLSRNTTWTLSRDTSEGLEFAPTTFYDGQGILVKEASNIDKVEDLNGKSICVASKTTAEANLKEQMRKRNLSYAILSFEDDDKIYDSYELQKCDAATSDRSELFARRSGLKDPSAHQILEEVISKEPLGSVIANEEPEWFDAIKWVTYATIKAEELGINSQNINSFSQSKNPEVKRFLGQEGNLGENIGLSNDFAKKVVERVGNYGEIYDHNLGQPYGLERGINALGRDGGLIHAPPFR